MFDLSYLHLLQLSAQDPHLLTQRLNLLTDQLTARIFTPPSDDGSGPSKAGLAIKKPTKNGFLWVFWVFLIFKLFLLK
jgi:hypothetical protein